ncbi:MAG: hypothetical protein WC867_01635 [Candidatus Pacearchaeota archaeon]|jgi:hypothetical protein
MEDEEIKKLVFQRNPPTIKNKIECFILYNLGFFGNKVETAKTYKEIIENNWIGSVSLRSRNKRINRNMVSYGISIENIPKELEKWKQNGIDEEEILFSKTPPDDRLLFQGEIMNSIQGIHIVYSTLKKPMNIALKEEEKILTGINAIIFLKQNLTPSSLEDIKELLKIFPNDVIEFSTYEIELGSLRNRNTIIWEVRGY